MNRKNILVHPSTDVLGSSLKVALARLVPVSFTSCANPSDCKPSDTVINLSGDDGIPRTLAERGIRCFHFGRGAGESLALGRANRIAFGDSRSLDKRLRGRTVCHNVLKEIQAVELQPGDDILAFANNRPIWVQRKRDGGLLDIVSLSLPVMTDDEDLVDYFNGSHFIQLLPLVHFLRQVSSEFAWTSPPLKACFMFDDPNLHWSSYGFIPYSAVVQQAKASRFHVAFATVPLDAWFAHRGTARLFRENPGHISLLFHGNDHTRAELAGPMTEDEHLRLLAQSLKRIARMEKRTGLKVGRIMAPPHGAYAAGTIPAMLKLGFEGACISPWSLRDWSPKKKCPPAFGLETAELLEGGFPALPRFRLNAACEGQILISAFLDRPIIPVGHHDTVAGGLELLIRLAGFINSFDNVTWESPESMLYSHYYTRRQEATLWIRPYSCKFTVTTPPGVETIVIEAAKESESDTTELVMTRQRGHESETLGIEPGTPIRTVAGDRIHLKSPRLGATDHRDIESPQLSAWPPVRRLLCEFRDRCAPVMSFGRRA